MTERNIRWIVFGTCMAFAICITAIIVGGSVRASVREEERVLAIKDMADAMKIVCPPTPTESYPEAYACIGGLQLMLETIDVKRRRGEAV